YGVEIVIKPGETGFANGSYTGQQEIKTFLGTWGWTVYYKSTEPTSSKVWVQWSPRLPQSGTYEISAFIPTRHATSRAARYKIHGARGAVGETLVSVDQSRYKNQWVTLGVFDIDKSAVNAGAVFLNDLTRETGLEIAFDAVRWREVLDSTQPGEGFFADGYDAPVGTETERRSSQVWPGRWIDASPFGKLYFVGTPNEAYHTGADLNLPNDADRKAPIYASASGVVVFAARMPTWGNIVIIKHDPLKKNGKVMYGRYAHVDTMLVKVGQRVQRGEQVATVGNAFGQWAYHLHFDLSPTTILESQPQHWPGKNQEAVLKNYIDPRAFIEQNRP
ncbi:MAG: peptidoglycan DD-metalloendopeptidase family protein, partial [Anaerolineae bacterium]|nr:peptidoglycan DD-metalloendopeptidase family protein [Anaerolineae bacterium]